MATQQNPRRPKQCRACRAPDNDDLISIQLVQSGATIGQMVQALTGIEVSADKNLPQNICLRCLDRLGSAYQFRCLFLESDNILRYELYPQRTEGNISEQLQPLESSNKNELKNTESKIDTIPVVKLEIQTLDGAEEHLEEQNKECPPCQPEGKVSSSELESAPNEPVDSSIQELISVLTPEQNEISIKPGMHYLKHYDEMDYEVLSQTDFYDHIRFLATRCCSCSQRFFDRKELHLHGLLVHTSEQNRVNKTFPYECSICFRKFANRQALLNHRSHLDGDRFHCRECDLLLDTRKRMVGHLERIHSIEMYEDELEYEMNDSENVPFPSLATYDPMQYKLVPQSNEGYDLLELVAFPCCGCNEIFDSREEFEAHSQDVHLPNKNLEPQVEFPFECNICFERFAKKASLTVHRNAPNKRRLCCRICEGVFKGEGSYRKHLVQFHGMLENDDAKTLVKVRGDSSTEQQIELIIPEVDPRIKFKSEIINIEPIGSFETNEQEREMELADDFAVELCSQTEESDTGGENESDEQEILSYDEETTGFEVLLEQKSNKYLPTRQRKEMGRVPGNILRTVEQLDGYNIVEILKERCCFCLKFFDSLDELNEHTKKHQLVSLNEIQDKPIKYQCEYCLKNFNIALLYVVHKRVREQKQFYQCRLCDFVIDNASRLKNHMLHNDQHAKFFNLIRPDVSDQYDAVQLPGKRCCGCGEYFDAEAALIEHSRIEHPSDPLKDSLKRSLACSICDKRFYNKAEIDNHQNKTGSTVRFYCKLCDFATPSEARMLKHMYSSIHNPALPGIEVKSIKTNNNKAGTLHYCCFEGCKLPFHARNAFDEHIEQMHSEEKEQNIAKFGSACAQNHLQCMHCCRTFRTVTHLKQHRLIQRAPPKSFVCAQCGVSKSNKAALKVHEMMHTGERPFECKLCDKRFTSQTILTSHMKCHVPKKYQCNDCGEKFARSENLKRHIQHRHSEATFCCSYCPRKMKTREAQIQHERSHTGEKPFECRTDGCGKRYASITDRRRHEMLNHTGERPHSCSHCSASFVRKRQLTIHERKHTGERPYACERCGKGFIDAPQLKKHSC